MIQKSFYFRSFYKRYYKFLSGLVWFGIQTPSLEDLNVSLNESSQLLEYAYNLQRRQACEIFGFIVADADRQYSKKCPANNWIAYALKGNSLNMDITRLIIEEVHDVCKENNLKILTEVSDGQFHKCACRTIDGKPLTWLTWQKDLWSESLSKSKEDLLNILESVTYVSEESIAKLSSFNPDSNDFSFEFKNIEVNCFELENKKTLDIWSNGGPIDDYNTRLSSDIYTTKRWEHKIYDPIWDYKKLTQERKGQKRNVTEEEILELIACEHFPDPYDISLIENTYDESDLSDKEIDEECNAKPTIISEVLSVLIKGKNGKKWIVTNTTDLYVNKLESAESIAKNFYSYELDYIAQLVSKMSGCKLLYLKSANKATKVNILSKYFGDKSVWFPKHPLKKHQELESLFTCVEQL